MNAILHVVFRVFSAALLLAGLCVGTAEAQSEAVAPEVLAQKADVVAVGKVTGMRTDWDQSKSRIITHVTVAVGEYLKGSAAGVLTVTSPGGEIDGVGEWYSHTARFTKDEDVIVFAERDRNGDFRITGGRDGKITLNRIEATGSKLFSGEASLEQMKARIKTALQEPQAK